MYALAIKQLKKTYDDGTIALNGINLHIPRGDFFALLGVNGAGKSTTINLVSSLISKTSGHISINGHNLEKKPDIAKLSLGVVPQEFNLNAFETCYNILITQAGYYGLLPSKAKPRADLLLKQLGLWEKRHSAVRQLSGGMKRRLMIARALMHNPALLLLDEPTAGVDIEIRRNMWDFLKRLNDEGTTIILTTHYLEEAEQLCNHVAIIDQGEILKDTSMQKLLQTFSAQTFILTTAEPVDIPPPIETLELTKMDSYTFELCIDKEQSLNHVFSLLTEHGLVINSLRNKTNRLEELFINMINHEK